MDMEFAITVTAAVESWNHVYNGEWAATDANARQSAEDGLMAGETPFEFVTVEENRVVVRVDLEGWAFLMGDIEPTESQVDGFIRDALTADGTLKLS